MTARPLCDLFRLAWWRGAQLRRRRRNILSRALTELPSDLSQGRLRFGLLFEDFLAQFHSLVIIHVRALDEVRVAVAITYTKRRMLLRMMLIAIAESPVAIGVSPARIGVAISAEPAPKASIKRRSRSAGDEVLRRKRRCGKKDGSREEEETEYGLHGKLPSRRACGEKAQGRLLW